MIKIHEHLIEVTSPSDVFHSVLTVQKLWEHLLHYAEHPHEYFEPLQSCKIQSREENGLRVLDRLLDFGSIQVRDTVHFEKEKSVCIDVMATNSYKASRLTIQIECTQEDSIFLRFTYEEDLLQAPQDDIFLKLRKKAYEQKDMEMVQTIRARFEIPTNLN